MDRSFLKHAAVYGLATLFVQAGGFVLLPIYLRCLGPGDYGALEVVGRLAETVGTLLLFGGFRQALITFHQQAGDEAERRRVIAACYALVAAAGLVGVAVAVLAGPWLGEQLVPESAGRRGVLLALAIGAVLIEPFSLLPLALLQARMQSIRYVLVVILQFSLRLALCVLLVRVLRLGLAGALGATAITGVVFALALSGGELLRGMAWPRLEQLRGLLAFSLPLLPGGVCFFALHHGDRFFLLRHAGAAEVGTYALGYKLALAVGTFSLAPVYMVWGARMYEVARAPGAAGAFGRLFTRALALYLYVGLGLCLFAREVILLLGGPEYYAALGVLPVLALACLCQAASSLMDAGLYVCRRTGVKFAVTAAAAAVMVALYAALIPSHGATGAAAATLGGFAFLAVATYLASQRVFPVCYEWGRLAGLLALVGGAWLAGQAMPGGWAGVAAKACVLASVPALAWLVGLVSGEEKALARSVFKAISPPRWGRWAWVMEVPR